jgi:hypothetical protein
MDCDSALLKQNVITITPIHYDLTCLPELERLRTSALPVKKPGPED